MQAPENVHDDLTLLPGVARAAGDIARPFWRAKARHWDKADGTGPVSEADLAVNTMLHDRLLSARPDHGWLSEESLDDPARLSRDRVFIVDPIDGTRAFIDGQAAWSHSIAIAEHGRIIAGVVYLPVLDKIYAAALGRGATLNDAPIRANATTDPDGATMLASRPVLDAHNWQLPPGVTRHFRPSLAYRMCLVAEGRFDAMLALRRTWEWDIAAGALIVTEAGGTVSDRRGAPLLFNNPVPQTDGTLSAAPVLHPRLIERLL